MRKILLSLIILMGLFGNVYSAIGEKWSITSDAGTDLIVIDKDGNMLPKTTGRMNGTSGYKWGAIHSSHVVTNSVDVSSYVQPIIAHEHWTNLPTASSFPVYTVLAASGTLYLANVTYGTNLLTQLSMGARDIRCAVQFDGDPDLTVVSSFTISGITATGASVVEVVQCSTASAIIGATNVSNNAFLYISSITVRIVSSTGFTQTSAGGTNVRVSIGFGTKIGLCNDIVTATDMIGAAEDAGVVSNPGTLQAGVNTTYDTVDFVTNPDGTNNYDAYYKIRKTP